MDNLYSPDPIPVEGFRTQQMLYVFDSFLELLFQGPDCQNEERLFFLVLAYFIQLLKCLVLNVRFMAFS